MSFKDGVDFSTKEYWLLHDDREEGCHWLVEFPKGVYPHLSCHETGKAFLKQYEEWGTLIFGEWETGHKGRVIKLTPDIMEHHSKITLTSEEDRIHFRMWKDKISTHFNFGTLKAKRR